MPDSKKVLFVDDDVQPLDLYRRALATLGVSSAVVPWRETNS